MNKKRYGRILVIAGILVLVLLFFTSGLHRHLSLESIKEQQLVLQDFYNQRPAVMIAAFAAVYIPVVALNLPGAVVLGLAAGALFGALAGTIIISFASSIGATLACLLSRYLLRDWVQRRFGEKLKRVNAGFREEGAFYLFALRLMPVIPFFIINMVMGLTPMRLWTFYWVSQLGMLPGTAVFVNAGSQIGRIDSLSGIISPSLILSLALLGIFPLIVRRGLAFYRERFRRGSDSRKTVEEVVKNPAISSLPNMQEIRERCTDCGACRNSCAFLMQYGTPKQIVEDQDFSSPQGQKIAYECSLCGLCTAVCPEKLGPARLFLEIRRRSVADGNFDPSAYRTILGYEQRGVSPLFSWYGFPESCDTVFFPGCTLPGTRPAATMHIYRQIRQTVPSLGLVLDCCAKPSHDLGRTEYFKGLFGEMNDYLVDHGIRTVLTACPNCTRIFRQYGRRLNVRTIYETVRDNGCVSTAGTAGAAVCVHDPCAIREDIDTHRAIRGLLTDMGHTIMEMKHHGKRTLCCGEGGMAGAVNPSFAKTWAAARVKEAAGQNIVTYCAGCAGYLGRLTPTIHIADLLYRPEAVFNGNLRISRAPFTYVNRLLLKRRMKKEMKPIVQRTRSSKAGAILRAS